MKKPVMQTNSDLVSFNGRQFTIDPVNGHKINHVIAAANMNHTHSINTAQHPKSSYLLPLIEVSGHTSPRVRWRTDHRH